MKIYKLLFFPEFKTFQVMYKLYSLDYKFYKNTFFKFTRIHFCFLITDNHFLIGTNQTHVKLFSQLFTIVRVVRPIDPRTITLHSKLRLERTFFFWPKVHFVEPLIAPVLDLVCPSLWVSNSEWISCLQKSFLLACCDPEDHNWCNTCLFHQ